MALSKIVWKDGEFIPLEEAVINVFSPSVQYGYGGFEGVRFYFCETKDGPAIFRLADHIDRLFYTAKQLEMEIPYSTDELTKAICRLILACQMGEGYIRPCIVYTDPELGLRFEGERASVFIVLSSWEKKLKHESLRAKISPVVRIHPDSTDVNAKITGHYPNSIRALRDARRSGYDEAILLDYQGYVAEASAENLFIVTEGDLFTPPLGTILPGITRDSIITLARDYGYKVSEGHLTADDLLASDEVFVCGTAMEILSVVSIDKTPIGCGSPGEITEFFAGLYRNVVRGRRKRYHHWLTFVNKS